MLLAFQFLSIVTTNLFPGSFLNFLLLVMGTRTGAGEAVQDHTPGGRHPFTIMRPRCCFLTYFLVHGMD